MERNMSVPIARRKKGRQQILGPQWLQVILCLGFLPKHKFQQQKPSSKARKIIMPILLLLLLLVEGGGAEKN